MYRCMIIREMEAFLIWDFIWTFCLGDLSTSELDVHSGQVPTSVALLLRNWRHSPDLRHHYISACLVDQAGNQFSYNHEYLKENLERVLFWGMEVSMVDLTIPLLSDRRAVYGLPYRRMSCQERNGQLCNFCEKNETTSASLPTRRPCRNLPLLEWNSHRWPWTRPQLSAVSSEKAIVPVWVK